MQQMETRCSLTIILAVVALGTSQAQQLHKDFYETLYQRVLHASEPEQLAYLNLRLNQGLRATDDDAVGAILGRSSIVLPIIERKIEQVLKSPTPEGCFTSKDADPKWFVGAAANLIASVGDEYAMREIAKLVALDEKRFGTLVLAVLYSAQDRGNPFVVAYKGVDIGDPKVDAQILSWAQQILGDEIEAVQKHYRPLWAEAMAERYDGQPLEASWEKDPIASGIEREVADSVHKDVLRLALEAREKKTQK